MSVLAVSILIVMISNYPLIPSAQLCTLPNQNCVDTRNTFQQIITNDTTNTITIIHISDTHNLHNQITLPKGDILIHTGDFSNDGTKQEYHKFNQFLGKYVSHFPLGIFVLLGNHDYKFLDGTGQNDDLIHIIAHDKLRKTYFQQLLPNAHVIDNDLVTINVNTNTLTMFGIPWTPFQSKPTYPEKVPKSGSGHYRVLEEWKKNNDISVHSENVPNFYDRIPDNIDIVLSHIPPFGVFDQMPIYPYPHWGSSSMFLETILDKNVRCLLFGHVHAQRGYWEKIKIKNDASKIIGGSEYAKRTFDTREKGTIHDLMMGKNDDAVQFIANSALMSDRSVQPFSKKKIVGKPRVIKAYLSDGQWIFHCDECCDLQCV
eukprot:242518_1